jgi:hypothetical protein
MGNDLKQKVLVQNGIISKQQVLAIVEITISFGVTLNLLLYT